MPLRDLDMARLRRFALRSAVIALPPMIAPCVAAFWSGFGARFAAAGRLSLTNYVGASVVMAAMFYSWGLGWFGLVNRVEATLVALAVIGLILTASPIWARRFGNGPLERLWRGQPAFSRDRNK